MNPSADPKLEEIRHAMTVLEAQRGLIGDAVVETALSGLRQQLAALEGQAAQAAPSEERRLITILFTDMVGSTALAEKRDPEEWRQTIAQLHARAGDLNVPEHRAMMELWERILGGSYARVTDRNSHVPLHGH